MIQAIAIDDELPALQIIDIFCQQSGQVQLLRLFNKPNDALKYINKNPVDLVFIDINMPALSGIDLVKSMKHDTLVIFTTAYSEYALDGFNLNAVDYLLKPFSFDRFQQAIEKARQQLQLRQQPDPQGNQNLYIRADYSLIKIDLKDILFIEGLDDYLKIHLQQQKPIVARMTLKSIIEKLPEQSFMRIHRSYVVSLARINSIRGKVVHIADEELPIGSSYEKAFLAAFNK
ncbi:MAG TPA: LytTR family DNA-binding domain-containing protein [Ferruginibacter sp.]|nr:LytTR family DNA-binding domain-containing protein [Ferruginibacter sp.]